MKRIRTVAIIPFYSTKKCGVEVLAETVKSANRHVDQIVVVDDGSHFLNKPIDKEILLCLSENCGKATAIRKGLQYAIESFGSVEVIGQIDFDRDQTPNDLPAACALIREGNDLVIGDRYASHRNIPEYRIQVLRLQEAICKELGVHGTKDAVSGLSAYTSSFARSLLLLSRSRGCGWDFEKVVIASLVGAKVISFPLSRSRLRSDSTLKDKLVEVIEDGFIPHSTALRKVGKGTLIDFLERIFSLLKRGGNFEIDLGLIGGTGKMHARFKEGAYTID